MPVDFTHLQKRNKAYAGANGNKISVIYEGEQYMLKFPPTPKINKDMSYSNSCFSEYLGCQIYEIIGVPVQKTILGTYTVHVKEKIVVDVYKRQMELLALGEKPQAIICANQYLAFGCVEALKRSGIAIPRQMAVLTFDDFPFSKRCV